MEPLVVGFSTARYTTDGQHGQYDVDLSVITNSHSRCRHVGTREPTCIWALQEAFLFVQHLWKICRHVGIPRGTGVRVGPLFFGGKQLNRRQQILIWRRSNQLEKQYEIKIIIIGLSAGWFTQRLCPLVMFECFVEICSGTGLLNDGAESPQKPQRLQPGLQKTKKL